MSNLTTTDIFVAGLGPAGASAAGAAARAGYQVIAVDRKLEAGVPVQCAEFVPSMLAPSIAAVQGARCQAISAMQTFVETDAADWREKFPGVMVDRARFDQLLVSTAIEHGAQCRFDTVITNISADGTVSLASGERIKPRVMIGADGPRSRVGQAIGSVNTAVVAARQLTVPLLEQHTATDIFLSADYVGGYAWLFPRGAYANVGLGVVPAVRQDLKKLLATLHQSLVEQGRVGAQCVSRTGGLIPVGGPLEMSASLGDTLVLLSGDAAGLTNPITGAGISAAVQSGQLAGETAGGWLAGNGDAIDEYRDELNELFGVALNRALDRRRAILADYEKSRRPTPSALRQSWIAYPEYWAA